MPPRKQWVFSPDSGGTKIPDTVKRDVEGRIRAVAEKHFKGKYIRLDIRFKGQFCYIDAFVEPELEANEIPGDWPGTQKEYIERLRNIPVHLCRLRYFGKDKWGFAFYTYSNEKYELAVYPDGDFFGKPEDAFLASAVYLKS